MRRIFAVFLFLLIFMPTLIFSAYNIDTAYSYAQNWWYRCNHNCCGYSSCCPWSYWGSECCGYSSHGGDCANFVSQILVSGGHPYLNTGGFPCRGYPCGKEEIGANNLKNCLRDKFGNLWTVTNYGYRAAPAASIQKGDFLCYCNSSYVGNHAVWVMYRSGSDCRITCHSSEQWNKPYTYLTDADHAYYYWIHYKGGGSPPSAPTLVSPSNGATGVSLTPTLDWNAVSGASSYQVNLDNNSDFSSLIVNASGLTGTSYNIPSGRLSYNTRYYWRVRASNSYGSSGWSSIWSFTTQVAPPSSPSNVVFRYNESGYGGVLSCDDVSGATAYEFAYRPSGGSWTYYYDKTAANAGNIEWPGWYFSGLQPGSYDFAVRAKNAGGTSAWVYVNSVNIPDVVRPGVPGGVVAVALSSSSIRLSWTAVSGATGYSIY
ncbi:MAG: amidase domain-containing protein, partial [Endomicrobia bacterium]|nr:amidase domain-containing protein [Endomicrobiia bacterium]